MNDMHSLSHTQWNCKYHVVFAPKYRRKAFFGERALEIGAILRELCRWKGINFIEAYVCPDHVHMLLKKYIANQLKEDQLNGQLTMEDADPFTGSK